MTLIGVALMAWAVVLSWLVYPRGGEETLIMRLPGAWVAIPLTVILCFGAGGAMVYTYLGQ